MATYQILYWHDIPAQVRARGSNPRERVSVQLPERFQEAIDAAAMAAGVTGSDSYLMLYQWGEELHRDGAPADVAAAVAAELDTQHPHLDWQSTARAIRAGYRG